MKTSKIYFLTQAAIIAALYVVLVFLFEPISFSAIQFRIAEALTILPYFSAAAIPGLAIGCLIANILGGCSLLDIVFGTLATLIAAIFTYVLRKYKFLAPVPPVLANAIIIPWVLRFAYGEAQPIWFLMLTVGIGELLACGVLGMILLTALDKVKVHIFKQAIS